MQFTRNTGLVVGAASNNNLNDLAESISWWM